MKDTCRICLCSGRRLFTITNTVFQEVWEKLTDAKFNTNDGKPLLVCYICGALLRKSHQLIKRAQKAEELLKTVVNNGSELSQRAMLMVAGMMHDVDYNYAIGEVYQLECKQFERNAVEEIEERNEQAIDVNIKEEEGGDTEKEIKKENVGMNEEGDYPDSSQEENLEIIDVESGLSSGENIPQKKTLKRKTVIILKKIDMGMSAKKSKLNELQQTVKQIKFEEATEYKGPLIHASTLPNNYCEVSDTSYSQYVSGNLKEIYLSRSKHITNATVNCYQVNKTSPKVNILPKHNILMTNTVDDNNKKHSSNIYYNNDENEIYKFLPKSTSPAATSNFLDESDEGNKSNICNKKRSEKLFTCHICPYKCRTKNTLNIHLRIHTGEKPYKCDLCDYRCSRKGSLESHVKYRHTKELKFSCNICQYKCLTKSTLNVHLRRHTGEKPYACDFCDYRCAQKGCLIDHIKAKHTKEKKFSCHICQFKFVKKEDLNRHLRIHTGEKPYACDFCDYRCAQKGCLIDHIKAKHTKEKKFSCHICQFKFVKKEDLNRHLRIHTGEKPYTCDFCDYRCAQKGCLIDHIKAKHTKEKKFSCHICQFKFVKKEDLNRHLRIHTGEKPYTCDFCDYRCAQKGCLIDHIKAKHTKEKKFSCHICQFKFVKKEDLNRHLRIHTGEKPYTCDFCDYRCAQKGCLIDHIKAKHTKEKKFSCHICQFKFVKKEDLNRHLRIHTGEKPYTCDLCHYRSIQKSSLIDHIQLKHTKEKKL